MKISEQAVVVEQEFELSADKVWDAITNLEEMKFWFFENIEEFLPEIGFKTQFKVQVEERVFTHLWEIIEVDFQKKITYNWRYVEYPGIGIVEFKLIERGDKTTLVLTNTVIEDFPDEIPEFSRESCLGGWEYFIKGRLREYLEK